MKLQLQICPSPDAAFNREFKGRSITIGRSRDCELIVAHDVVSSRHARLECTQDGQLLLTDLDSTNGSFVNGTRVYSSEVLRVGHDIGLGQEGPHIRVLHFISDEQPAFQNQRVFGYGVRSNRNPDQPPSPEPELEILPAQPDSILQESPPKGGDQSTRELLQQLEQRQSRWGAFAIGTVIGLVSIGLLTAVVLIVLMLVTSGHKPADVAKIASSQIESVYLVARETAAGEIVAIGTAFAIAHDGTFATNAHVARSVKLLLDNNRMVSVYSRSGERAFRITSAKPHAEYREDGDAGYDAARDYPDVGLLSVEVSDGEAVFSANLAKEPDLCSFTPGTPLFYIGYPKYQPDYYSQRERIEPVVMTGRLVRAFDFYGQAGEWNNRRILELDMENWGGASGSPIFDYQGRVVGLVWGQKVARDPRRLDGYIPHGVRVDSLRELLHD